MASLDAHYMKRALHLARRGKGFTSPNPSVGAVVVKNGTIVGEGWHTRSGEPHAETRALKEAGRQAEGATLYVTLEPCCTQGKTPPCTVAIIREGITRVVVPCADPNPRHRGRGIELLRENGITVDTGIMMRDALRLNEDFACFITTGIPFTTVKTAASLDGKIATVTGDTRWISCEQSRKRVHQLRRWSDAVVVGRRTVENDDPLLTARDTRGRTGKIPWRVILDSFARIPLSSRVLKTPGVERTIVAVTRNAPRTRIARLEARGATVLRCAAKGGRVSLRDLWRRLGRRGIMSAFIEGGGQTVASAFEAGIVNKVIIFFAPFIIGGETAPAMVGGKGVRRIADAFPIHNLTCTRSGKDFMIEGYCSIKGKTVCSPES